MQKNKLKKMAMKLSYLESGKSIIDIRECVNSINRIKKEVVKFIEINSCKNMVYFISAGNKAVKIGMTSDLAIRIRQIETNNHESIRPIYCIPCKEKEHARKVELMIHEKYKDLRIKGEWFSNEVTELARKDKKDLDLIEYHKDCFYFAKFVEQIDFEVVGFPTSKDATELMSLLLNYLEHIADGCVRFLEESEVMCE